MTITATEFKVNLGKYLILAETEDIFISKNGKVSVKLVNSNQDKVEAMRSLFGSIPKGITLEEARDERLSRI
ncbi:MAG: type II toxin-antitoxin system prevent-host-death family antitoxin [Oscillospiraceae bacterium]|nr:type II toxin-antitoxin system prevent-host-death family antitoxin [Oscillospiraceae bacterium]